MKRAFLVMGEANSGNRMMRKAFMAAGCYGDTVKGIQIADLQRGNLPDTIVIARSGPNGEHIPDFIALAQACIDAGYTVTPVMIWRKSDFALAGHCQHYGLTHQQALHYRETITFLAYELACWLKTPLVVVPYEPFVTSKEIRDLFFRQFGLNPPAMEFYNANEKYLLTNPPLAY